MLLIAAAAFAGQAIDKPAMLRNAHQELARAALYGVEAKPVGDPVTRKWIGEPQKAEQRPDVAAVRTAIVAMEAWKVCLVAAASRYAVSREPAESIASASLGKCSAEEEGYLTAILRIPEGDGVMFNVNQASAMVDHFKQAWRPRVMAVVFDARTRAK